MTATHNQGNISTKEKILVSAAKLFAEHGYEAVSMRDLAREVGIKNPSIYNHFSSKKEILTELYKYYTDQRKRILPYFEDIMKQAETDPPYEVLMNTDYHFDPNIEALMHQILAVAAGSISTDPDSRQFIIDNVLSAPDEQTAPVLTKLIELGRIETLDVDAFINVIRYYCFSAVALVATPLQLDIEAWKKGLDFLYSTCIKPTRRS